MIARIFKRISMFFMVRAMRQRSRRLIVSSGYTHGRSEFDVSCHQCNEPLDDVLSPRIVHAFSGEVFKCPTMAATMCPRCAWVADGEVRIPVWKWVELKGKGTTGRAIMLRNERAGLRMRLAEIEEELNPKKTLILETRSLRSLSEEIEKEKRGSG